MAETLKNAKLIVPITTPEAAYTCPPDTEAIVKFCQVCNVDTASRWVTVGWTDSSDSNALTRLIYQVTIPINASLGVIDGPLVLEAGDSITAVCSYDHMIELSISVLEIS